MRPQMVTELLETLAAANTPKARALATKIKRKFKNIPMDQKSRSVTLRDDDYQNIVFSGVLVESLSELKVVHDPCEHTVTVFYTNVNPAETVSLGGLLQEACVYLERYILATSGGVDDDLAWENASAKALLGRLQAACSPLNTSAKA